MREKLFTVHYPEEAARSLTGLGEQAVLVKEGFSWPAFLLAPAWLVFKRMWIVLTLFVAAALAIGALSYAGRISEDVATLLSIGLQLLLGFEGNDLYRWTLERRRYRERAVVSADNAVAAERRFFAEAREDRAFP